MSADQPRVTAELRCAHCGQPIAPRGRSGLFRHVTRVIAACDLDSDHAAVPQPQGRAHGKRAAGEPAGRPGTGGSVVDAGDVG